MADLGPGTMPRGKYPESPAPAGSHALISRTPTPGGMLHANLGPPRPTPRNFQPPLPRFPSRLSPRRMSGTTAGRILSHPLPRPTPTPAASARTQAQLPSLIPRAAAPAAACVPGRSTGQHMPPQQALKINGNNAPHKTKNPSCYRSRGGMRGWPVHRPTHAPATSPQNKRQQRPPKPKTPRAVTLWRHACLTTPEGVKESPPDTGAIPKKKNRRHSGIFRVADLRPGTMPRGKYPESPAPAGSHALISRTPTPGGMLHANLGPPRPPPRNFQPPLPRFPSRLSPRRMSGTTAGRILSHPLPRPTPTPAASARTQAQLPSLIPRAAAPAAACVPGRPTGQHMLPQQALKINGNNAPHKTKNPSCCRSRGGMRAWPVHRPTHAPATSPQNKRQQRPPTKPKTPRAVTLWRHAWLATPEGVKESPPDTGAIPKEKKPSSFRNFPRG